MGIDADVFNAESQVEENEEYENVDDENRKDKIMLPLYNDMNRIVMNGGIGDEDESENGSDPTREKGKKR